MNPEQRSVNIPDGRSALFRARSTIAAVASMALLAGACTSGSVSTTTTSTLPPATTASAAPAPTPESTTTTAAPVETTTTVASEAVGSHEALLEAMSEAIGSSVLRHGVDASQVPIPQINNPDPLAAVSQLLEFDLWVYVNAPVGGWSEILAVEGSAQWSEYVGAYNVLAGRRAKFETSEPFDILEIRLANADEIAFAPAAVLADAGSEGVFVFYRTRLDPHTLSTTAEPELATEQDGWRDQARLALVVPTRIGWQFVWSEVR